MRKYLIKASYTASGTIGLLKDGGTHRKHAVETAVKGMGGSLETMYYAFGQHQAYLIVHLPDDISAAALELRVNASGFVVATTTVLLSCEDIDAAAKKSVDYHVPGTETE